MGSTLWWIFDILVVFIAIHVIISNAKRGMTKVIIMCIGYIAVTLIASLVAGLAAPNLYESVAARTNITALDAINQRTDFDQIFTKALRDQQYGIEINDRVVAQCLTNTDVVPFDQALYDYVNQLSGEPVAPFTDFQEMLCRAFVQGYNTNLSDRLPKYVKMGFEREYLNNLIGMREFIGIWYSNSMSAQAKNEEIERRLCAEPTREVLQIFLYFILFSICMVIIAVISAIAQNSLFFNVTKLTDHIGGAMLGILEAGAMLVLFTLLVRLIIMLSGNGLKIINEDTVFESYIFSHLYNNIGKLL